MGKFVEQIAILFLLTMVVVLCLIIVAFMDYTGIFDLHSSIPDTLKKNMLVQEYIEAAEINSKAPRDQVSLLLEEKKKYVEKLLAQMKVESKKILDEKQRLELLFRQLEEEKKVQKLAKDDFDKQVEDFRKEKAKRYDEDLLTRLDNLAATYSKMEPVAVGKILKDFPSPKDSYEVLRRLKPKTLGKILETVSEQEARKYVELLQK